MHSTGIHTFIVLCFAELCSVNKLKVCGKPALSKSIDTIFPTVFAHFVSLSATFW